MTVKEQSLNGRLIELVDELVGHGLTLAQARREFERQFIAASLRCHEGNVCRSARSLGVHRNTLRNKVSDLGIGADEVPRNNGRRALRRRAVEA